MFLKGFTSFLFTFFALAASCQTEISAVLKANEYDLPNAGKTFILKEAHNASFLLLGELHGEKEIPDLMYSLWAGIQKNGFNHIAAEISPWAARKLEFGINDDSLKTEGLWTNRQAKRLHTNKATVNDPTLWGCDMEEISLDDEMRTLAKINHNDSMVKEVASIVNNGYSRQKAASILKLMKNSRPHHDSIINNISLFENIKSSLIIDSLRALPEAKLKAQITRENLMKIYFLKRYLSLPANQKKGVFVRFGRNHLHKGFDDRGLSTLGNFINEYAFAKGLKCFNIAAFAAGGKCKLLGETYDADETQDDIAFNFLSKLALYDATIFDLRQLRIQLHNIAFEQRNELDKRLLFWADSYDAIICYKKVEPLNN
jgi:hypothetical protein